MKMNNRIYATIFLFFLTSLIVQAQLKDKTETTNIKANLEVLASDEFEGREATTRGEKIASVFIASELEKYGVKPYGDNGTYFQNFDLLSSGYEIDSKIALLDNSGAVSDFLLGDDFIKLSRGFADSSFAKQSTGIVFAGYGLTQKEYNYDDYANIDVKGKTVLMLSGEPPRDKAAPTSAMQINLFNTDAKVKLAREKGAVGILVIVDERLKSFWNRIKEFGTQPSISFISKEPQEITKNIPVFTIDEKFAGKILAGEKYSYEKLTELLKAKEPVQSFEITKKLKYDVKPFSKVVSARNVIGLIEGTDPILKNEFIVISAHYDHLGTRGGVVSNGADDDGSGTVAVLESMRMLSAERKNRRSILAIFNTGEEKGLLGSRYATDNGSFMKDVIVDINMDMVGRENIDSLHCIGSNKLSTEFGNIVKEVNSETVKYNLNYKYDDPNDPNRFYSRSDHYNFARKGIPVVFFFDDMRVDYHKPTDDVDKINFGKILKTALLSSNIALKVANLDHKLVVDKKPEEEQPRQRSR